MANEKITNIVEEIKTLTILELADLVKAVEEEFGIKFNNDDCVNIKTVGDVVDAIEKKVS